jgi:secreted Zn-dependent insulinase-like peptidase
MLKINSCNKFSEDLNTLEELAVSLFGDIEKKNVDKPYWKDPIYREEQLATKTVVVPVKDIRVLSVNFLIPDQSKYYRSMVKIFVDYVHNLNIIFIINFIN